MSGLSQEDFESLIGLVENELLRLSTGGHETCKEYRQLQNCRHTLLAMSARVNAATEGAPTRADISKKAGHLRPIIGGKA